MLTCREGRTLRRTYAAVSGLVVGGGSHLSLSLSCSGTVAGLVLLSSSGAPVVVWGLEREDWLCSRVHR